MTSRLTGTIGTGMLAVRWAVHLMDSQVIDRNECRVRKLNGGQAWLKESIEQNAQAVP